MKLSEYFKQQHSQKMPAQIKSELFSRIQKEKNWLEISTKISSKFFFFVSKKIMYTSLAAILVFVVFWWVLLDKNKVIDFWLFSVKQNNAPNWVFADYIAEIVEFNGDYSLVRDWKIVTNSDKLKTIQDWDVVSFPEWTDLIFNLQDWTQAKIIWPAEFSITKTEKWYQISLFDGKFFRIYCPECTSDMEIVTPDFSISQEKDQTLDLHIAKEDNGEMLVKNDGDVIIVKTKNSEKESKVKQVSSELVAITPNENKINILEDSEVMLTFMAKNNISATFTLSTEDVQRPDIKPQKQDNVVEQTNYNGWDTNNKQVQEIKDNETSGGKEFIEEKDPLLEWIKEVISSDMQVSWNVDENIAYDLWLIADNKKVPNTEQMDVLKSNLNSFFLMNIFESAYNKDNSSQSVSKLADRINAISSSLGYSTYASSDLTSIKNAVLALKGQIEKDWYISPSYILQMEKVANWCDELSNPSKPDRESLKWDLPIHLRLR